MDYDDDLNDDFESQFADHEEMLKELEAEKNGVASVPSSIKTKQKSENVYDSTDKTIADLNTSDAELSKKRRFEKNYESLELDELSLNEDTEFLEYQKNKKKLDDSYTEDTRSFKNLDVRLTDGQKLVLKLFEAPSEYKKKERSSNENILGKSIQALKLELEAEAVAKCKSNIQELSTGIVFDPKSNSETELWVEKFKPKNFLDLLSDDGTNRLILSWVKSWDYVVFGKELHSEAQNALSTKQLNIAAAKKRKRVFNQYEADFEEKLLELDQFNRPKIKVCLISGPPGLGKTTLAHVIAKHAGYNIIEMNASDDRSAEAFKQNIESVTQTRGAVNNMGGEKAFKPSCLIIDEIDGAPSNAIQVLIDHVNEKVKAKKGNTTTGPTMLRPIICICNDLYSPALKNLRPISIVFQCPPIATQRLAERLNIVCSTSQINADMGGLVALCDKTRNDIRSSLNTLQFLSSRSDRISTKLINELTIGLKDYEKNIYEIMNEIFFTTLNNKKSLVNMEQNSKFTLIYNMCQNCDMEKLFQALYENYLSIKFRDNNFQSVKKSNEWLMYCDTLNKQVREKQDFFLYRYQAYMPALFYKLFSTSSAPNPKSRLKYPHVFFENMVKLNRNFEILRHFQADMSPLVRVWHNSIKYTVIDLLPFLVEILQPNLRSVALQLFTKVEKDKLGSLIKTMLLFNLTYRQEKTLDGQYTYVLDPNVDECIRLNGMKQRKQLSYVIKQQVARELTLEKVKLVDKFKGNKEGADGQVLNGKSSLFKNMQKITETGNASPKASPLRNLTSMMKEKLTNELKKNEQRGDKFNEKNCFSNFFIKKEKKLDEGLTPMSKRAAEEKRVKDAKPLNDGVWLKYKEGFINAVRYNIKISDLL